MLIKKLSSLINFTNSRCLLENGGFVVNYSPELGRPVWSVYSVNKFDILKQTGGRTSFKIDPRLRAKKIYQLDPNSKIFQNNDYTRGHLVPAFMMSHLKSPVNSWNKTFLMSNVVPQNRNLNVDKWHKLEKETKELVLKNNANIHIIVGCETLDFSQKYFFENKNLECQNNKTIIWYDKKNNLEYKIPNIFYQIVITKYETSCYLGFNNSKQLITKVSYEYLEKLINRKILF